MNSARDIIARACFDPGRYVGFRGAQEGISQWQSRAVLDALTAAGFRVVANGELDAVLEARIAKLEAWAHEPFDFTHLIRRLEAVENALSNGRK